MEAVRARTEESRAKLQAAIEQSRSVEQICILTKDILSISSSADKGLQEALRALKPGDTVDIGIVSPDERWNNVDCAVGGLYRLITDGALNNGLDTASAAPRTAIGTKVTGINGTAIWTGLKPGTYVLEEVDPADGYSIIQSSETIFLADSGEQSVVTVRFTNAPDGTLLIRKVCSVNPSVTLQDAEFKVAYADGSVVGDSNGIYRTDENGEIRISGLKPGKSVVVTDTRAPAGFIIDTQSQTIQIQEGKTVSLTFKNQPVNANLKLAHR